MEQITNNRDELRLQHVNSTLDVNGLVFDDNGLVLSGFECDRKNGSLAVIDRDNAIVSFTTSSCAGNNATDYGNAYVQKISSGAKAWGNDGKLAAPRNTNGNDVLDTKVVAGPSGGAFILFLKIQLRTILSELITLTRKETLPKVELTLQD